MKKLLLILIITTVFFPRSYSQQNANDWTWIKGANTPNQVANYGTKGVEAPTNNPGARSSFLTWTLNDKLYLMGGFGGSGALNDLWVYNINTNNWTWLSGSSSADQFGNYGTKGVPASTNVPGSRVNGTTWVYNNKLYLMGGFIGTYSSCYNDLWEYDPATNLWTWLKGANTFNELGVYGTLGEASPDNTPGARELSSVWIYNNKIYLFGGYFQDYGVRPQRILFNDLWEYDPTTNNWRWIKGNKSGLDPLGIYGTKGIAAPANIPGARKDSFTWSNNEKAYIFGGNGWYASGGQTTLSDLWEYDVTTNNWKWLSGSNLDDVKANGVLGVKGVPAATNFIGAREQGSSFFSNNKLFVMGGYGKIGSLDTRDDVWEYDLSTNYWTWLKGSNTGGTTGVYGTQGVSNPNNNPGARVGHQGWYNSDKYYMMGGVSNTGRTSDLWQYVPTCTEMTTISSGDWNDANIWSCQRVPTANDSVTINGHTISVTGSCFAKNVNKKLGAVINVIANGNLKIGNP